MFVNFVLVKSESLKEKTK